MAYIFSTLSKGETLDNIYYLESFDINLTYENGYKVVPVFMQRIYRKFI